MVAYYMRRLSIAAIVLKGVPEELHRHLKEEVGRNRRSMSQQLLIIMKRALTPLPPLKPIKPVVPNQPFTHEWTMRTMLEGRE